MFSGIEIRSTLRRLTRLVPLILFVVGVDVVADPARVLRDSRYEREIATILLSGRHAAGVSNYDDRLVQKFMSAGGVSPDVLVIGSSRVMAIQAADFAPRSFYNASVSSATLNDVLGLYSLFSNGSIERPGLVIIGIDPWTFLPNEGMRGWLSIADAYERACREIANGRCDSVPPLHRTRRALSALLSPTYFQASVAHLWETWRGGGAVAGSVTPVLQIAEASPEVAVRRMDGSLRYPRSFGADTDAVRAAARQLARDFVAGRVPAMPSASTPSPGNIETLEALAREIRRTGREVEWILAPFHPDAWAGLSRGDFIVALTEKAARQAARRSGVTVRGSFDPRVVHCEDPAEFDDPTHPRHPCLARVLVAEPGGTKQIR